VSRIIGIDLGTTNSLVAVVEAGIPMVLADRDGSRLTPSVVHYPEEGQNVLVGSAASRLRILKPDRTLYSVKRFIGRRASETGEEERRVSYCLERDESGAVAARVGGRLVRPEEVSAEILKKLKGDAEFRLEEKIERAVITVPAYFNDAQRQATSRAGELAGLKVERILNEPTAAALAYGLDRLTEKSRVAVYDLGGGTFDLSILELNEGVFQVLSTNGNTRLGGDDLDQRVVEFLAREIQRGGGPDVLTDPVQTARAREAAEEAKIRLSTDEEVEIRLPFLTSSFSFETRLTRRRLEDLTRDILERTRAHCLRSLADAKLEPNQIDQVILVGGQTRMPLVRRLAAEFFGCAEFEEERGSLRVGDRRHKNSGPRLNTSQNPDEAVALGAAIQAEILSGGFKNVLLLDITPLSLGIETFGGLMNVIIPRNTTIPTKAGEVFTTAVDHQPSILIHVLQGERERAKDNWSLGKFTLEFERAPKGVPRVGVQFEIDASGILEVLARDIKTGRQQIVKMASAVDVEDAEVQKMVEESVEHAFEDLRARQWIEARLRAEETAAATRGGLEGRGGELGEASRAAIHQALGAVQEALATEHPETKTGDLPRLNEAARALDEATRELAGLLMDRAMEEVLRKRGLIQ
jgi:molecular chaperone DnaK